MKYVLSFILVILSFTVSAKEINIANTGVSFVSPDEFKPIPQTIIDYKWPQKNAPKWVVGNETASTTIAYDLKSSDISAVSLSDLMSYFKKTFERVVPGLEWKKREIIDLSNKKWLYLEMTSNAVDTDIYNIMLLTSYGKKMLIFNFNSTKEDFTKYESKLRKSIQTIQLPQISQ